MKFGKKGAAASEMWAPDTILFWILYGVVVSFIGVYFLIIVSKISPEQIKMRGNVESFNLMQRFLKPANCFAYEENGVASNKVIDYSKFSDDTLNSCYAISNDKFTAFRLTLDSLQVGLTKTIKTKNWNDNRRAESREYPKDILVYANNKLNNGELTIEIQNLQ